MGTIAENLNTLYDVKENIKTAIENKGVAVGEVPFNEYAQKIDEISVGGGDCEGVLEIQPYSNVGSQFTYKLFYGSFNNTVINCQALTTLERMFYWSQFGENTIPNIINTNRVTSTYGMFENAVIHTAPMFDTSSVNTMERMFWESQIESIPQYDTSNVTNMRTMFVYCRNLTAIPEINTKNVENVDNMFYGCNNLTTIPLLDFTSVSKFSYTFEECSSLTNLGGFKGLHRTLDLSCSNLITRESMLNVFENADVIYDGSYITVSKTVYNKLSEEDIAIATNKGWTISIMLN